MTELKGRSAWVFDLDGTLTQPVHDFAHIRRELGIAPEQDILATIESQSDAQRCTMLAQLDQLERHYASLAQPAEGAIELLSSLLEMKCHLGILTRNSREMAICALGAIGASGFFLPEAIIGRDEARPKPDPHGLEILIGQWGEVSTRTVMVGDFRYDLEAGRAVGAATVHVDSQGRSWPELTDLRVTCLTELNKILLTPSTYA